MAKITRWKLVPAATKLKPGDRVIHYEELTGTPDGKHRKVRGWIEHAVVVQTIDHEGGYQDCMIAAVGNEKDFHPKYFDGARPYFLRYYNTSLVKI